MKIMDHIYLVGSGNTGLGISNDYDCHVYLLDGGSEIALIDAGGGRETHRIIENAKNDGLDARKITRVFLSHSHSDHAAGASKMRELLVQRSWLQRVKQSSLRLPTKKPLVLIWHVEKDGFILRTTYFQPVMWT